MSRFLTMLEVSQKQAYIFASNKLQDNVVNSAVIAEILSPEYIERQLGHIGYTDEANMVYAGGGHTILEFADREMAVKASSELTKAIYTEFEGLEVFAKITEYRDACTPAENLKLLTEELEKKKSLRMNSFHRNNFGVEVINSETLDAEREMIMPKLEPKAGKAGIKDQEYKIEQNFCPAGYQAVTRFEELGGSLAAYKRSINSKAESNFIAVVHIDGNGMGKRVSRLYDQLKDMEWSSFKKQIRAFSEGIDSDFKAAFKEMNEVVGTNIRCGKDHPDVKDFPVRRLITAGDDICFVTAGEIGIECAVRYIQALTKTERSNAVDGEGYHACAGVAIVHKKYPFFKAYELAEELCSNAKKYGAAISKTDNGASVSAIDWHIEYGEVGDSLEEIRQDYETADGKLLCMRPYIVECADIGSQLTAKKYKSFKALIHMIQGGELAYGTGKIKGLRTALKQGEAAADMYMRSNRMEGLLSDTHQGEIDYSRIFKGEQEQWTNFIDNEKGQKTSYLFDAIELMDVYVPLND